MSECRVCKGDGVCVECDGLGTCPPGLPGAAIWCDQCEGDGLCAACDGTGSV